MAKVRVAVVGTVGRSVLIETNLEPRITALETRVTALAATGASRHALLQGLQVGDDHPQYTMWQAAETIRGLWNFATVPNIQGNTLAEYIEDVVGGDFFDFLQDTESIAWTYRETANELEANVLTGPGLTVATAGVQIVDEYVEDLVGSMLANTSSINLDFGDSDGSIRARIVDEYVEDLVGSMLENSASVVLDYGDSDGSIKAIAVPAGINHNALASLAVGDPHPQYALAATTTSGVYTPTLTNVANLTTSTAYEWQWSRTGNTAVASGRVDVDPALTATSTQLGISLPIASDFASDTQCSGVAFASGIAAQGAAILGDVTNNRAQMQWVAGDVTNQPMYVTIIYRIV